MVEFCHITILHNARQAAQKKMHVYICSNVLGCVIEHVSICRAKPLASSADDYAMLNR